MSPAQPAEPKNGLSLDERDSISRTQVEEPRRSFVSWVNRLLGGDRSFLAGQSTSIEEPAPSDGPVPSRIDRFEVIRELGRGGFGVVYLARDATLDRNVAIKVPHAWLADDPAAAERCLKEAQLASKLRDPGIVTIHDICERDGRIDYVVQEYVEGTTLQQLMSKRRLSVRKSVELLLKISEAIQTAHAMGVYHRDLKPANVIIDRQGGAHILDFGLAIDEEAQLKLRGQIAGTMAYMSPEQLQGDSHLLDGRTDIWALGVIFYELLTGRKPFRGNSQETAEQVTKRAPAPPRQFQSAIPKRVEACCLRCLAKALDQRFASAADLIDELKQVLVEQVLSDEDSLIFEQDAEPYVARDTKRLASDRTKRLPAAPSRPSRGRYWIGAIGAIIVVAIGLVGAISFYASYWRDAPHVIDLLGRKPIRLKEPPPGTYLENYVDGRLWVQTSTGCTYLFQESPGTSDYDIEIEIGQFPQWQGIIGVYFDLHPSQTEPGDYIGYRLLLGPDPLEKDPWNLALTHSLLDAGQSGGEENYGIKNAPVKSAPENRARFLISIRKGQLQSVRFAEMLYPDMAIAAKSKVKAVTTLPAIHKTPTKGMTGQVAILISRTTAVISSAKIVRR